MNDILNKLDNIHNGVIDGTEDDVKELIRELMNKYDEYQEKWVSANGSDTGFDDWFTTQVLS